MRGSESGAPRASAVPPCFTVTHTQISPSEAGTAADALLPQQSSHESREGEDPCGSRGGPP